jgi:quinol monooxygenase YgiN
MLPRRIIVLLPLLFLVSLIDPSQGFSSLKSSATTTFTPISSKPQPYAVNMNLTIKENRREEFIKLIQELQRQTLDMEEASLQYVVGEDTTSPNTFHVHKQFTSLQGYEAHRTMPHVADWDTFVASDPFEGDIQRDAYVLEHATFSCEPQDTFGVQVVLCPKPERRTEFLQCIRGNYEGSTNTESLCHQYAFGESTTTENRFLFHEEYFQGKDGFEAHQKTPHFAAWEAFAATDPFSQPPEVNLFSSLVFSKQQESKKPATT